MNELKNFEELSRTDKEKIMTAIDTLLEKNPGFPDQLDKLANIKKTKPFVWTMALKKLGAE